MKLKKINNKKLYINILLWAYKKGQLGFTQPELFKKFCLDSKPDLKGWVVHVFFQSSNDNRGLIDILKLKDDGKTNIYALTDKGMSSVVDYLGLRHTRRNGYIAATIGIFALAVAIFTGYFQIQSNKSTNESLKLTKEQINKLNDPFFNFEYVKEDESFKISAPEDVNIEHVEWYFQDAKNNLRFEEENDRFIELKENSSELKRSTVADYLVDQILSQNLDLTSEKAQYFMECYDQYYPSHTLSVLVTIHYSKRGNSKKEWVDKYVYLDNVFSTYPRIMELTNIDHPDINRQFFEFNDFKKYLALPANFDWESVSENEIAITLSGAKSCNSLFPDGSLIFESYRAVE